VAARQLEVTATIEEIDEVKDSILRLTGVTEAEAYHLPVGFRLRLPVQLIEEINARISK
jgi:hypothetical protein